MSHGAHRDRMNGYPIQPAKIQSPALRDETLARDRLLDWLAAKVHQRVDPRRSRTPATARPRSSPTSRGEHACGPCGIGSTRTTATGSRS